MVTLSLEGENGGILNFCSRAISLEPGAASVKK